MKTEIVRAADVQGTVGSTSVDTRVKWPLVAKWIVLRNSPEGSELTLWVGNVSYHAVLVVWSQKESLSPEDLKKRLRRAIVAGMSGETPPQLVAAGSMEFMELGGQMNWFSTAYSVATPDDLKPEIQSLVLAAVKAHFTS